MTTHRKRRGAETQAALAGYLRDHGWPTWGDRFLAKVEEDESGCWLWTGRLGRNGYAQIRVGALRPVAHRVIWEHGYGAIPTGLQLDHLCRVRHCVNPAHLDPVTPRENTMRSPTAVAAVFARRSHCEEGHLFDDENTMIRRERRICRTCHRAAGRRLYAKKNGRAA